MIKEIFNNDDIEDVYLTEAISHKTIRNFLINDMLNTGAIVMLYMSDKQYLFKINKDVYKLDIFGKGFTLEDMKTHKYITRKFYGDHNNSKFFINQFMLDLNAFRNGQVKTSIIDGKTKLFPR